MNWPEEFYTEYGGEDFPVDPAQERAREQIEQFIDSNRKVSFFRGK